MTPWKSALEQEVGFLKNVFILWLFPSKENYLKSFPGQGRIRNTYSKKINKQLRKVRELWVFPPQQRKWRQAGPASWAWGPGSCRDLYLEVPYSWLNTIAISVFWAISEQEALYFHFLLSPTNDVAGPFGKRGGKSLPKTFFLPSARMRYENTENMPLEKL